jgi:predicted XRE-type DNA-binding protein
MKSKIKDPIQLIHFKMRVRIALAKALMNEIETINFSKENFATLMHKQPSQISKWLSGDHNFTIDTLCEISFRTKTPITNFLKLYHLVDSYKSQEGFENQIKKV